MGGHRTPVNLVLGAGQVLGQVEEVRPDQPQQRAKRTLVTTVRGGGHQDQVAIPVAR